MELCIIKQRITFLDKSSFLYTLIQVKEKGFSISDITREDFKTFNLPEVFKTKNGTIYATPNFKELLNSHEKMKSNILILLEKYDT